VTVVAEWAIWARFAAEMPLVEMGCLLVFVSP